MHMELICIVCPNGCHLTVEQTAEGITVTGNKCIRGEQYGRDEFTDPKRVVTAVVRTTSETFPTVPVKSSGPVTKGMITDILRKMYTLEITLPVKRGETCIPDCDGKGTSIVFTRTVPPVS